MGDLDNMHTKERVVDLEGLEERKDLSRRQSQRYQQKMTKSYELAVHSRIFTQGQLELKAAEHVRRNIPGPSQFTPKWEGPYVVKEVHDSEYYYLISMDGTPLADPVNGKWLKQYNA